MTMNFFLETERLKMVPFEVDDLDLLHQTFTDPFVRKYLWDDESITIEQAAEILQVSQQHFEHSSWGLK